MFVALEKPVSYIAFACAFLSLVWKAIGLDWIPVVGSSWRSIFEDADLGQYPRRSDDENQWNLLYLIMYGVLGSAAQFGGILISKRSITREMLVFYARLYGSFHLVIGIHHLCWCYNLQYGKLELWRFDLPWIYQGTAVSVLVLMYHASRMVSVSEGTANLQAICHRKAVMDTSTVVTFISVVVFLFCNILGIELSFDTNRLWWAITMYSVPVVLMLGFVL